MILIRWIVNALTLLLIANVVPGMDVSGFYAAMVTILILSLINAVIRPVIIFFTLPVTVLTLGLFTFVINGAMFWFASTIVQGLQVDGFIPAFWAALLLSIVSYLLSSLLKKQ